MKTQSFVLSVLICACLTLNAQQWGGVSNQTGNIYRSGKVGIGTTNPLATLHVNGDVRGDQNGALRISTGSGYVDIGPKNTSFAHLLTDRPNFIFNKSIYSLGSFSSYSTNNLNLQTNGVNRMTILTSNGNVGVGTANPQTTLHVNGDVRGNQSGALRINSGNGYIDVGPRNTGWAHIYTDRSKFIFNKSVYTFGGFSSYSTRNLYLQTNGSTRMTIQKSNGNVGINTTTPDYRLDVNGIIRAKEVRVQTGWSDHVFLPEYDLPTLNEEDQFIKENGHLIGFESEKDMGGEVQLADVTNRQQETIEKLMLHTIEMDKRMNQLETENIELKKLIEKLIKE